MTIYQNSSCSIDQRVEDLIARMTPAEKLAQMGSIRVFYLLDGQDFSDAKAGPILAHGIGQLTRIGGGSILPPSKAAEMANTIQSYLRERTRLGIPAIVHEECCSGFTSLGATSFPQMIGMASTWEPELVEAMSSVIRAQMRAVGAHQGLSPMLDVSRDPRWGRMEESFGEDPTLVSQFGMAYVRGLQGTDFKQGILATAKHFLGHGISEGGMNCTPVHVGPRELRDVFVTPFEAAIRDAGLAAIMNAYSELDGEVVAASRAILTGLLRHELGFQGMVVSDYEAIMMLNTFHAAAPDLATAAQMALAAGIEVELPNTVCYGQPLLDALEAGKVDIQLIDAAVGRVLCKKFELGLFDNPFVDSGRAAEIYDTPSQRALARRIAQDSLVLLKNEGGLLPLDKHLGTIAVIGPNADRARNLLGDYSHPAHIELLLEKEPQLRDSLSGNSGEPGFVDGSIQIDTILKAVTARVGSATRIVYARGCDVNSPDRSGFDEAVRAASRADVTILVLGDKSGLTQDCTCGESRDRADLGLPGVQAELAATLANLGKPIALVLVNGRPISIGRLVEQVPVILEAWLPGEEGGNAIADVLFGDAAPGGRLPVSFPRSSGQIPLFYNHKPSGGKSHWNIDYIDQPVTPLFPFGFGLSYTTFEYTDLEISPLQARAGETVTIALKVKNSGAVAGDEVVQLYIRDVFASHPRPVQELKGFKRISLQPGQTRCLQFHLPVDQLAFYDDSLCLVVEPGEIQVMVGSSSADIRLQGSFEISGTAKTGIEKRVFVCPVDIQ